MENSTGAAAFATLFGDEARSVAAANLVDSSHIPDKVQRKINVNNDWNF